MTIEAHEARVRHDLACLNLGDTRWTRPLRHEGVEVLDAVIVGGG